MIVRVTGCSVCDQCFIYRYKYSLAWLICSSEQNSQLWKAKYCKSCRRHHKIRYAHPSSMPLHVSFALPSSRYKISTVLTQQFIREQCSLSAFLLKITKYIKFCRNLTYMLYAIKSLLSIVVVTWHFLYAIRFDAP